MPLDLPVKVRSWKLTVYPRSDTRERKRGNGNGDAASIDDGHRGLAAEVGEVGVRPGSAAHNAVGLAGESPVVEIDCLST